MYCRWTLDGLPEIAYAVSKDFVARPEFYKAADIPGEIVELRIEYGSRSRLPNRSQRLDINSPIFGVSDGYGGDTSNDKFRVLRKPLFDGCIALSELTSNTAPASQKPRILNALDSLRLRLKSFDGKSIRGSYEQVLHVSKAAVGILSSTGVSQVFGVNPAPNHIWPYDSSDANGSLLIGSISDKLTLGPNLTFTADRFQRLRRVAQQGREALILIITTDVAESRAFDALVVSVYTWAMSLKDYSGMTNQ
jgi:hypothetical protein